MPFGQFTFWQSQGSAVRHQALEIAAVASLLRDDNHRESVRSAIACTVGRKGRPYDAMARERLGSPTIGELLSESEAERCQAAEQLSSRSQRTGVSGRPMAAPTAGTDHSAANAGRFWPQLPAQAAIISKQPAPDMGLAVSAYSIYSMETTG